MKQPKIDIPKTRFETFFDAIGIMVYVAAVVYLIAQFSALPDQVPGHFNASGEADRWGSKMELIILPIVGGAMWLLLSILERFPHVFNYLNLREDNIKSQYKNGRLMMNVLKNEVVLLFSLITYLQIQIAQGAAEGLGEAFLPMFIVVIFGSMFIFLFRMLRM